MAQDGSNTDEACWHNLQRSGGQGAQADEQHGKCLSIDTHAAYASP